MNWAPGVDVVLNNNLVETTFNSKRDFLVYLKKYVGRVLKYLKDDDSGKVDYFKRTIGKWAKVLLDKFKDLQFFTGESKDANAMIAMMEDGGEERPRLSFVKLGLKEEEC